jgi:DNA-binding transcriptional MerR regulator
MTQSRKHVLVNTPLVNESTVATSGQPRAASEPEPQQPSEPERTWTVGELADELGVTTRTLRFYESEGLITPARNGAGRFYDHRDRARMRLILRGKRFGMSLSEIREIVGMYDGAASSEQRQLRMLLSRLDEIATDLQARKRDLDRTLSEIGQVARQCRDRLSEIG